MGEKILEAKFLTQLSGLWEDDVNFVLNSDLIYQSKILDCVLTVPSGFKTDFASVPRIPIVYDLFGDRAHHEAVMHDFLYRTLPHICTREQADNVFLEAMIVRNKNFFIRQFMFLGVRIGGQSSWR